MSYEYNTSPLGMGAQVYAESSIESGVPGVVEARQIGPSGPTGRLIPIDTNFASPIGRRGPLRTYATEYARNIGAQGPTGRLIPLGESETTAMSMVPLVLIGGGVIAALWWWSQKNIDGVPGLSMMTANRAK